MFATRQTKRNIIIYILALVLCIVLRVTSVLSPWDGDFIVISTGILILVWIQTLSQRIIDRQVRRLLIWIALFLLFYNYVQAVKYNFIPTWDTGKRYCWYAFYIPMIVIPMLCLFLAVKKERKSSKAWRWLWLPCVILILGVITNDLHQSTFTFQENFLHWGEKYGYGIWYFIVVDWIAILLISSIVIIFVRSNTPQCRKYIWLPMLPLGIGAVYCWMYATKTELIRVNGIVLLTLPQAFEFMIIGFLEGCIQAGLLQSNDGYSEIFENFSIGASIKNNQGELVFQSHKIKEKGKKLRTHSYPIQGGEVQWLEDVTILWEYREKLQNVKEELSGEAILLMKEGQLEKERAELEVRNRIYNEISRLVQKQGKEIQRLLSEETDNEKEFVKNLKKVCVFNAYIKRRSNLTILIQNKESILVRELQLSIQESMENLRMLGILCESFCDLDLEISWKGEELAALYDYFQAVIESGISTMKAMLVTLLGTKERLEFRMMVENIRDLPEFSSEGAQVMLQREGESTSLKICFIKEGEKSWG